MLPILENFDPMKLSAATVLLRLLLAMICAAVLGLDRTHKRHAAGFRTYVLVSLGACVAMMAGQFVFESSGSGDPARIGAQVVSGIGFLGAGTIIISGSFIVRGLTTAAGIWATGVMGLAFGSGFYTGGIILFVMIFIALSLFDFLQKKFQMHSVYIDLYLVFEDYEALAAFLANLRARGWKLRTFSPAEMSGKSAVTFEVALKMHARRSHDEVADELRQLPGVILIEEIHD